MSQSISTPNVTDAIVFLVEMFEKLSAFLKRHNFRYSQPLTSEQIASMGDKTYPWEEYAKSLWKLLQ
jgi:hypothetical protein